MTSAVAMWFFLVIYPGAGDVVIGTPTREACEIVRVQMIGNLGQTNPEAQVSDCTLLAIGKAPDA